MAVPPPTLCPACRLRRRLVFRNEQNFCKRKCDLCGRDAVSMYAADAPFPVYCQPCWWSDQWTPPELDYDPSRSFFDQFRELRNRTPHESTQAPQSVDSEYANFVANAKSTYLSSVILNSRDIFYSHFLDKCAECVECDYASHMEKCVRVIYGTECYQCRDSKDLDQSRNTAFSAYSNNLADCYGCINLKHKKYCIFNQQLSKEDYLARRKELEALPWEEQRRQVQEFWLTQPFRGNTIFHSVDCTGVEVYDCKNVRQAFLANFIRDGAYLFEASSWSRSVETIHDIWDCSIVIDFTFSYETIGGSRSSNCMFGFLNDDCLDCRYSMFMYGCSSAFGCVGLRNKEYRILNKEYPKGEYERLVREIVASMEEYGEFFPAELSPFAYNESIAQDYLPFSKEAALQAGFRWKDAEPPSYPVTRAAADLPQIAEAPDALAEEIIGCAHAGRCEHHCTTAFRILPHELQIMKQAGAELPRLCPNCRRAGRMPAHVFDLWPRECQCRGGGSENGVYKNAAVHPHESAPCGNSFSSPYAPDRPEIVYCEACYQSEVA